MKRYVSVIRDCMLFLICLIAGYYFIVRNIVGPELNHFPGDMGDARFNAYILEHGYRFFTGEVASYWDAPFMVPEPEVISFSDNLFGTLPFYILFREFGYDVLDSFQGWFLVLTFLNFLFSFLFLKWLFKNAYTAGIGAFIFTFSLALQSQLTHAQTFARFIIPVIIWLILLFSNHKKLKYFFFANLAFVYLLYCGIYLGFLFFFPFLVMVSIILFRSKGSFLKEIIKENGMVKVLLSGIIPVLLLAPLILPYIRRAASVPMPSFQSTMKTIPLFKSYLYAHHGNPVWEFLTEVGTSLPAFWDHQLFPGLFVIVGVLSMIFSKSIWLKSEDVEGGYSNSNIRLLLIVFLITFLCFIRINNLSIYSLVRLLPGFGSMRSMTRIVNIEMIFFAIGVAYLFNVLSKKVNALLLFIPFFSFLVLDNYVDRNFTYHQPKDLAQERVNKLVLKMDDIPKGSLISYEPIFEEENPIEFQLDAMLATQQLGLKCINGYSATSPPEYTGYWNNLNEESRVAWLKAIKFQNAQIYVIK